MFPRIIALLASLLLLALSHAADPANSDLEFSTQAVRADFKQLYQGLQAAHYDLYARRTEAEYVALYQRMLKGFNRPMRQSEVQIAFQRFVAYGRVAHARIDAAGSAYEQFRAAGGRALPLQIRVLAGRSYLLRNLSANTQLAAGDELLAIDGQALSKLLPKLGQHVSADNDYMLHTLLEHRLAGLLWQEWGERKFFEITAQKPGGKPFSTRVLAASRSEVEASSKKRPPAFELDWDKREARMLSDSIAYLRPGPFYNNEPSASDPWDNASFQRFVDTAFEQFLKADAKHLLVDLRDNPGGDNSFSDPMVAWFANKPFRFASDFRIKVSRAATESNAQRLPQSAPGSTSYLLAAAYKARRLGEVFSFELPIVQPRADNRFEGKVSLLINRHSYSNTVSVAALAQDYGFAQILGEETSDLATTYGAMERFELSKTGISVGFPKAQIIRPNGDQQARGVRPDVSIPAPLLQSADDPVLKRALAVLQKP